VIFLSAEITSRLMCAEEGLPDPVGAAATGLRAAVPEA
jgi:hypothetical protein